MPSQEEQMRPEERAAHQAALRKQFDALQAEHYAIRHEVPAAAPKPTAHTILQLPSIRSIVHYVLRDGRSKGEHRPAIIVKIWSTEMVQLQVFTDSTNDFEKGTAGADGILWATSVHYDEAAEPGTWHWPEE